MNKAQAIQKFWESFGLPAYDEATVPKDAQMPRITYNVQTDSIEGILGLSASLWYMSTTWEEVSLKAEEIGNYIVKMQPPTIAIDEGRVYITKGQPFAQRMTDPNDSIRRINLNIQVEFLTAC